jgi:hypothetical protein
MMLPSLSSAFGEICYFDLSLSRVNDKADLAVIKFVKLVPEKTFRLITMKTVLQQDTLVLCENETLLSIRFTINLD